MGEPGITEKILLDTVVRFESAEPGNAAPARLLREGIREGKLQDTEWISKILLSSEDSTLTTESLNESPES